MMMSSPACLRVQAAKWTSQPSLPEGTMPEMREEGKGICISLKIGFVGTRRSWSAPQPYVVRVPQRLVGLYGGGKAFAENLDVDTLAGGCQIGAQHGERDRFVYAMAPAS